VTNESSGGKKGPLSQNPPLGDFNYFYFNNTIDPLVNYEWSIISTTRDNTVGGIDSLAG